MVPSGQTHGGFAGEATPQRPRRNLTEIRDALYSAVEKARELNGFAEALLTSLRGTAPAAAEQNPENPGTLVDTLDLLAETLNEKLYELGRKLDQFDHHLGTGYMNIKANSQINGVNKASCRG